MLKFIYYGWLKPGNGPVAQPGRAPPLQGGGLGFKSRQVHIIIFINFFELMQLKIELFWVKDVNFMLISCIGGGLKTPLAG